MYEDYTLYLSLNKVFFITLYDKQQQSEFKQVIILYNHMQIQDFQLIIQLDESWSNFDLLSLFYLHSS